MILIRIGQSKVIHAKHKPGRFTACGIDLYKSLGMFTSIKDARLPTCKRCYKKLLALAEEGEQQP